MKLYRSSFQVVTGSLDISKRCTLSIHNIQLEKSQLEVYGRRSAFGQTFQDLNLVKFFKSYEVISSKVVWRKKLTVIRTTSIYGSSPISPNFGQYCKYQLIEYKPWVIPQSIRRTVRKDQITYIWETLFIWETGRDNRQDGKHTVIFLKKLCCVYMKPGRSSSLLGKVESRLKQTRSWQRRDKKKKRKIKSSWLYHLRQLEFWKFYISWWTICKNFTNLWNLCIS